MTTGIISTIRETKNKMNGQQRWNRYVGAINYCIAHGYYILCDDTKTGNVKGIWVRSDSSGREAYIKLKPRKYKPMELLSMIINTIGY